MMEGAYTVIVDTHMHLGTSKFTGHDSSELELIAAMKENGITHGLVMPQPTLQSTLEVHARIARFAKDHPGHIFGMSSIDPWLSEEAYRDEFEMCMNEYKFVAVKLHPMGHNISPLAPQCDKIYQLARQYKVPVIVHTGLGTPNSLPALMIEPARKYPDVTFVLAHAGFAIYTSEAIVAAKVCENIVLEPSWSPTFTVQAMVKQIGVDRILYGSDHNENIPVELVKYRSIGLTDKQLEQIFVTNPNRVFQLGL